MPNPVAFFAIHADDAERVRALYGKVCGWGFDSRGPPDFYLNRTGTEVDRICEARSSGEKSLLVARVCVLSSAASRWSR